MVYNMIYHNVTFSTELKDEFELAKAQCFTEYTWNHGTTMKGIANWCRAQGIKYTSRFHWNKNYGILANLWNLYSYIRFRLEEYGTTL
ncbi:MAG: hypothetical protein IJ439_03725 [Tyzzerella sp.]|nr:hypothetical protein [Tyzzerella sp.]